MKVETLECAEAPETICCKPRAGDDTGVTTMWKKLTLDAVCQRITDGAHSSPLSVPQGKPMASVKDLTRFGISLESCRCISDEDFDKLVRQGCKPVIGDVLIAKDGATALDTVCEVKRNEDVVLLSSVAILRPNPAIIDSSYLHYYLDASSTRSYLKGSFISGAAIPRVVLKDLKRAVVVVPPLPEQRLIAGILSAYDDLIENSQRRIRILESMARSLYREWFVNFRFPGHENIPLVPSSLGDIPQGWEVKRVPECVDINPRVVVLRDGKKPFIPMSCLSNDSMLISKIESREGNSGAKFQNGDTLFARITPCLENGKTGFVQFLPDAKAVGFGSTEFIVLRSRTLTPEFVYLLARSDEFRGVAIKSMSGASGRQRVQEKCFADFQIVQPSLALLNLFSAIVVPSFRNIYKLHLQIQNLRLTRDLLLPRLLSGQVELKT